MHHPRTFTQRLGASLFAPRAALAAADEPQNAGRTGTDVAALLAIVLVAVHTRQLVVAGWLAVADSIPVGFGALAGYVGRAFGTYLIAILAFGVVVTAAAGRKRSIGRDFDLACVAFVPFVVVELTARVAAWLFDMRGLGAAVFAVALAWSGVVVVLAILHTRARAGEPSDTPRAAGDRETQRMSWGGRSVLGLAAVVLVLNSVSVARQWDELRPIARGDLARPFELPLADGTGTLALADLRGKVVLVDFWATWCGPCRDSMPAIQRVYERFHKEGLEVISVNTDYPPDAVKALRFARNYDLTFPVVVDDGHAANLYNVTNIPYMVLVDHQGVVRGVHRGTGRHFERDLSAQVEQLLRAASR